MWQRNDVLGIHRIASWFITLTIMGALGCIGGESSHGELMDVHADVRLTTEQWQSLTEVQGVFDQVSSSDKSDRFPGNVRPLFYFYDKQCGDCHIATKSLSTLSTCPATLATAANMCIGCHIATR